MREALIIKLTASLNDVEQLCRVSANSSSYLLKFQRMLKTLSGRIAFVLILYWLDDNSVYGHYTLAYYYLLMTV
jgi:hypothetical protein